MTSVAQSAIEENKKKSRGYYPRHRFIAEAFIVTKVQRQEEFKDGGKKALHDWIGKGPMRPV